MNATNTFLEIVMKNAGISKAEAEKVLKIYKKLKLVTFNNYDATPHVKHGAFYDKSVILKALKEY